MSGTCATGPAYRLTPLHLLAEGGRWRTEAMRSHAQPVLYWFTRGQGRITVQGVTRGYGPHNAVLLPEGTMHGFDTGGQITGHALFLPRDADLSRAAEPLHVAVRDAALQAEMTSQIDNIARELGRGAAASDRALRHHAGLLAVWIERQAEAGAAQDARGRAAERLSAAFSALLERDFRQARSVADYAADLGVTATHLSRSCKAACGRSALALLQDRLHYESRRMLRDTDLPVKDVARRLGFRSAAYFTRAFQSKTGATPSGFRRDERRSVAPA